MNFQRFLLSICFAFIFSLSAPSQGHFLDSLYLEGAKSFYALLAQNLDYVDASKVGVALVKWQVVEGSIKNIEHINSLGEKTERELERALLLSKDNWKSKPKSVEFILPVRYKTNRFDYYVDPYPASFLKEMVFVKINNGNFKDDHKLIENFNKMLAKEKYEKALSIVGQLIQRNPLNEQLRKKRIYCFFKLDMNEEIIEEKAFIDQYIEIR